MNAKAERQHDDTTDANGQVTQRLAAGQVPTPKRGLLEGISLSQVVGTALAAVTALALSSEIGIVGSFIGAAVAAVVSTAGAQVYATILSNSASKLRDWRRSDAGMTPRGPEGASHPAPDAASTRRAGATADAAGPVCDGFPDLTARMLQASATDTMPARNATPQARLAPERLRAEEAARHQHMVRTRVAVAALLLGLVAVMVTAGIITLATNGGGIGAKVGSGAPAATTAAKTKAATTASTKKAPAAGTAQTQSAASPSTAGAGAQAEGGDSQPQADADGDGSAQGTSAGDASAKDSGSAPSSSDSSKGDSSKGSSSSSAGGSGSGEDSSSAGSSAGAGSSSGSGAQQGGSASAGGN